MNPPNSESIQITQLLAAWSEGEEIALEKLFPVVETELRRIAHNYMRQEKQNHTLQTTALINEAYLKLVNQKDIQWQNRAHFFAISANIMRRILTDHARERLAEKRGGGSIHINLSDAVILSDEKSAELVALNDALEALAKFDKVKSRIVELRFFGGLTLAETAEVMGLAPITISTHWKFAKAWLLREMNGANAEQAK